MVDRFNVINRSSMIEKRRPTPLDWTFFPPKAQPPSCIKALVCTYAYEVYSRYDRFDGCYENRNQQAYSDQMTASRRLPRSKGNVQLSRGIFLNSFLNFCIRLALSTPLQYTDKIIVQGQSWLCLFFC